MRHSLVLAGFILGLFALAPPVAAVESRFSVLLDTDNDPATGCTVVTPAGVMDGVEAMLVTVVESDATGGTVQDVFRRVCADPGSDTFGPEIPVDGGWPVGMGAGIAGFNVVETWMPPPAGVTPINDVRLGLTAENELGDEFALLTTTPGGDQAIVLQGSSPPDVLIPIPTAGAAGLVLLALALLIAGLIVLRRRAALFAVMLLVGAGYAGAQAYVFMFDWQGQSPLATSSAADPAAGVDVRAFFGQWDGTQLAFRLDAALVTGTAPAITSTDTHTCEVGTPCSFTYTADGVPEPDITLDGALPAGLVFDTESSTLSGTPEPGAGAVWMLVVTAANGIDPDATQDFTFTVNEAPNITSDDATGCEVGQSCTFTFTADGFPAPVFDLPGLPAGLSLDANTGEFGGTPEPGTGGAHNLTLTADNSIDPTDTQAFTLTIGEAPAITSPDSFTCQVGDPCDFTFTADGDPAPAIDITGALPGGVIFDAGSTSLQGTPDAGSGAEYALTVTAANGIDPDAMQDFTLTINEPPAITSADNLSCEVGQPCDFTFTAGGHPAPEFDLPGLPANLNLDPISGVLSGTPDAGTGGVYNLILTADNGIAPADTQAFTLTIGQAPEITSPDNFTCLVGDPCDFTFTADGDPAPTIDITGALPGGVTFDAGSASLQGAPDAGSGAEYALMITAANGINPDATQNFTLTVNEPPAITSADNLTCQVGQPCDFTFTADGHPAPGFDLPGLPAGLILDPISGVLSGTPDAGTGEVYNLTLTAANGIAPDDTQAFTLTIGEAPVITSPDNFTCQAGNPCDFTFTATGFPAPEFELPGLPAGLSLDPVTGVLSGTPDAGTGALHELTLAASNGVAPDAVQDFTLTVNEAPSITSTDNLSCQTGEPCDFTFTADGHPAPEFDLPGLPAGLALDAGSGVLSGTPDAGTGGVHNLTLSAANGIAPDDTQAFTLTIGQAPEITSADNFTCSTGSQCEFTFTATGEPAPAIDVIGALPDGVTFNAGTVSLEGTPDAGSGDEYVLTVSATNGIAPDAEQMFTLTVSEAPVARDDPDGGIPGGSSPGSMPYHGFFDAILVVADAGGVLANDDIGFPAADIDDLSPPTSAGGSVALTSGGGFTYDPPAGFTGIDSFDYCLDNSIDPPSCAIVEVAVGVRPSAGDGAYPSTLIGNVGIDTTVSSNFSVASLSTGDNVALGLAGTSNGNGSVNPDGTFVFVPAAGFTGGNASLEYSVTNGFGSTTGLITIPVGAERIWFADSSAGAGDGRLGTPFNTLIALDAAANAAGDRLFLYSGSYSGGIALLNNQRLLGQGASQSLAVMAAVTPPADSVLPATGTAAPQIVNAGGHGVQLASGNHIQGFNVGNTSGIGVTGAAVGTLTVSEVAVTGTGGALDLASGTLTGTGFTTISSSSGGRNVLLTGIGGAVELGSGSLSGATVAAFEVNGGTATITYAGSIAAAGAVRPVRVLNRSGGSVTLGGAVSGANGILLTDNAGSTIAFEGQLALNTGGNTAFEATGGGTVTATAANSTLQSTTATALRVVNTTIGAADLIFQSISSSGGNATGIVLNNTGSAGGLNVTGTGTAGSGGTIANKTGADAATEQGVGIYLNQTSNVRLSRMQLNDFSNYAILGQNVAGFELTHSVINGVNGTNAGSEAGDMNTGVDQGSVRFLGLTGQALVANSMISGGLKDNFWVQNTSGTLNRIVFDNVTMGLHSTADGNNSLRLIARGNSMFNATVQNSSFQGARGDQMDFRDESTGDTELIFTDNTLINTHTSIATGGGGVTMLGGSGGGLFSLTFENNSLRDAMGSAITLVKSIGSGDLVGLFENNTIGVPGTDNSGSMEGSGIHVRNAGGGEMSVAVVGNEVYQYNNYGIYFQAGAGIDQSGILNGNVTGNTIANPGNNPAIGNVFQGLHLNSGVSAGDTFQVCFDASGNTLTDSGRNGGVDARLRQRQNTTVRLPGYLGGATDTTAVQAYLESRNVTPFTGAHAAASTGFGGGGPCF